jgi:hypothetical protein
MSRTETPLVTKQVRRVVVQAHVWFDDDTRVTFSTPCLKSDAFEPGVLIPLVGDAGRWLVGQAGYGFPHPEGAVSVGMPFQVLISDSYRHNPVDSIMASRDYPGVEVDPRVPGLDPNQR